MPDHTQKYIDMMIHVSDAAAKPRLEAKIAECPGVIEPRVRTSKPNLLFVSYDPASFDIRSVPRIARSLGIKAQIVEI
ncbi:MAG: hypothetical protein Q8O34_08275 [Rhodocyclaceae bacterium]|nr:hypothetical protein [Rhodocyclaceae bacterium]